MEAMYEFHLCISLVTEFWLLRGGNSLITDFDKLREATDTTKQPDMSTRVKYQVWIENVQLRIGTDWII